MSDDQIIIDVREPDEYTVSHVNGALNIPPSELIAGSSLLSNTPKNTKIIVYCRSGSRSDTAIQILKQQGFTNLINGINADHVNRLYLS